MTDNIYPALVVGLFAAIVLIYIGLLCRWLFTKRPR